MREELSIDAVSNPPVQVISPNTVNIPQETPTIEVGTLRQNKENFEKSKQNRTSYATFWKTELRTSL
jgi:hypothetical protein